MNELTDQQREALRDAAAIACCMLDMAKRDAVIGDSLGEEWGEDDPKIHAYNVAQRQLWSLVYATKLGQV